MGKIVTMGELLLRLSPPGYEKIIQANNFQIVYGGGEANVAVSLANYGHQVSYLTKVPENTIGTTALATLSKYGVDCHNCAFGGDRLGIYFLENGTSIRPSSVIYDRAHSSMSEACIEDFDFDKIFDGVDLFHTSGITPILSESTAQLTKYALIEAKKRNITTSFDLNYRAKLWTKDVGKKQQMMSSLMSYVDICFGNARDAAKVLGYTDNRIDFMDGDYSLCVNEENMKKVINKYDFTYLISSLRESISASDNKYSALVASKTHFYLGKSYNLHIVDRVGTGDAFAAGFLHGILEDETMEQALEFAIAAAAIKHTIPGDLNLACAQEVKCLANGDGSGRVIR